MEITESEGKKGRKIYFMHQFLTKDMFHEKWNLEFSDFYFLSLDPVEVFFYHNFKIYYKQTHEREEKGTKWKAKAIFPH